jgi:hypothetical protein
MPSIARVLIWSALSVLLAGCPSVSTLGLARTLDKGKSQFFVAPEAVGFAMTSAGATTRFIAPQIEVGARYGVNDRVELGAKAWLVGAAVDGKFALMKSADMGSGMDVSVDVGAAFLNLTANGTSTTTSQSLLTLNVPLLVGFNLGGHQLVLGPKVVDMVTFGTAFLGSSVGFAFKVSETFRLLPELSAVYPVLASAGGQPGEPGGVWYQAALGFLFGGYN